MNGYQKGNNKKGRSQSCSARDLRPGFAASYFEKSA
jgi:hypothetical protein